MGEQPFHDSRGTLVRERSESPLASLGVGPAEPFRFLFERDFHRSLGSMPRTWKDYRAGGGGFPGGTVFPLGFFSIFVTTGSLSARMRLASGVLR